MSGIIPDDQDSNILLLENDIPEEAASSQQVSGANLLIFVASFVAAIGGILFGYDLGIISGALLQLESEFGLSCFEKEMVVSSMQLGAVVGSIFGGFMVDYLGRKRTIITNAVIFMLGAFICALSPSYLILILGRLVLGFAVSVSAIAECFYISEIAPAKRRGLLVSLNELGITLGLLFAYLVSYLLISAAHGWRWMFGVAAAPALLQGVAMLFLPPSPRYLMIRGREEEAGFVLQKLGSSSNTTQELKNIKLSLQLESRNNMMDLCSKTNRLHERMMIAMGLVFMQQITGQPNVLYYAPTIFASVGFESSSSATMATLGLGVVKVFATVAALFLVDTAGRRKFLCGGAFVMAIGIFVLAMAGPAHHDSLCEDDLNRTEIMNLSLANASVFSSPTTASSMSGFSKALSLFGLMAYVAAYAVGFGPITWIILSEIFPASNKGRAVAMATILNWTTNLVVSLTFLDIMDGLGTQLTFSLYTASCTLALMFVFSFVPETKGRSLERISFEMSKTSVVNQCSLHYSSLLRRFCCKELPGERSSYRKVAVPTENMELTENVS